MNGETPSCGETPSNEAKEDSLIKVLNQLVEKLDDIEEAIRAVNVSISIKNTQKAQAHSNSCCEIL